MISYLADDPYGPNAIPITVTVTNGRGFSTSTRFNWYLIEKNGPPTVTSIIPSQTLITPHGVPINSAGSLNANVTLAEVFQVAADAVPADGPTLALHAALANLSQDVNVPALVTPIRLGDLLL